jgi:hypothetical protein
MISNNSITLFACITLSTTSSTNFGVLVYVVGFLDLFTKDPNFCTNLLPTPNSNGCPSINPSLPTDTCSFSGLNIATKVCVPTLSVYSPVTCRPPYVYCCSCRKCCCKCWKCCGLSLLSI